MPRPASTALSRPSVESKVMPRCSSLVGSPASSSDCSTILLDPEPRLAGDEYRVAQIGDIDIVIGPFVAGRHHQNHVVFHKGFDL